MSKKTLHFEDIIADGENPAGVTNVNVNTDQVGTRPQDFMGRQQWNWGGERDGEKFAPYGNDHFMTEEEKDARYGSSIPTPNPPTAGKRRSK